jgi:hypothetical protein
VPEQLVVGLQLSGGEEDGLRVADEGLLRFALSVDVRLDGARVALGRIGVDADSLCGG